MANQENDERTLSGCWIIGIFAGVLVLSVVIGFIPLWFVWNYPGQAGTIKDSAGIWGDSFGFVNAILSGLAFAGVILTLVMQGKELRLQRRELSLQRDELRQTREQHEKMAKAQEETEKRLFLAAYMNALESLRQLGAWQISQESPSHPTFAVAHGMVIQMRVMESLHSLLQDLDPQMGNLHPALARVFEKGSRVWLLEQLLEVAINIRVIVNSYRGLADDGDELHVARNRVELQFARLRELRNSVENVWHSDFDEIVTPPQSTQLSGLASDLGEKNRRLFHLIIRLSRE